MKPTYQRFIAILIICIPGLMGVYGWTLMRDILFDYFGGLEFNWLGFLGGLFLFLFALYLIGGFIFYRDKKKNKIQPKLLSKEEREKKQEDKKKHRFLEKV